MSGHKYGTPVTDPIGTKIVIEGVPWVIGTNAAGERTAFLTDEFLPSDEIATALELFDYDVVSGGRAVSTVLENRDVDARRNITVTVGTVEPGLVQIGEYLLDRSELLVAIGEVG